MLTQNELKQLLQYDPDTGVFRWKMSRQGRCRGAGGVAGYASPKDGYVHIGIGRKVYRAHRLAFLWMTGRVPNVVDHVNRDKADNRWENLREATQAQNLINSDVRSDNSSGFRGVRFIGGTRKKPWQARINVAGKSISLKYHKTKEEAFDAYAEAARRFYGEYFEAPCAQ